MSYIPLGGKNAVGYCRFHKRNITPKQCQKKGCARKNCHYLHRFPHEYWKQRIMRYRQRRQRKERIKAELNRMGIKADND